MNRLGFTNALVKVMFVLLLWTDPPVWAAAICNPNIRATTPTWDFSLNDSNGTATDLNTGLIWMRCALGQNWDSTSKTCTGSSSAYTWGQALRAAWDYSFAGYNDWRLPNAKELALIIEERCHLPSINEAVFPGVSNWYYWSSSTSYPPAYAWFVSFNTGGVDVQRKSNINNVRLVRGGQSFGNYARGGGVTETPDQPVYGDPPPPVTVPPEKRKHLVLLIHGWNSTPVCWADAMKESIKKALPGYTGQEGCLNNELIEDVNTNTSWQICTYNWSNEAGFGGSCSWLPEFMVTPWDAYSKASDVGKNLADYIISQPRSYDFIHFIAHSAGSQVAEIAAKRLEERNVKPIIHTTFLDAFDPAGEGSTYGSHSDWAEQYVDMRRVFDVGLDDTDLTLPSAYNFDITALDPNGNNITGAAAHAWPYKWYEETIENPANSNYGFRLSLELGAEQFSGYENWKQVRNTTFPKGRKCVFLSSISAVCSESGVVAGIAAVRVIIDDVFDVPRAIIDATISPTGSVLFLPSKVIKLITGSPAWASLPIEVTEPIDILSFDYTFLRKVEGLLSVFFDDQLVFRSDERVEPAGLNHSGNVPIGAITSGTHILSFRLDAYNNTQSEIDISRIQLGKMEVRAPVVNLLTVEKVGSGSGTVTSDPAGIDCGTTCTASFDSGTSIALTVSPADGSTFAGWSPANCGSSPFTLTADTSCTATFTLTNQPPVANAGLNLSTTSEQQSSTVIQGTATDPDNDSLTYRWLEGQTELLGGTPVGASGEANLLLSTLPVSLTIGTHTLTLEVSDGKATATDDMLLTIDNSAPHAAPTGGGTYQISAPITVGGQVSDFDNDPLTYAWHEGATQYCAGSVQAPAQSLPGTPITLPDCALPSLGLGEHILTLTVSDGINPPVSGDITVKVIDSTAPTLSPEPDKSILWPPNHKMVNITIVTHASDNSGSPTLSAVVTSNEPQDGLGDGDTAPDWTPPVINQATGEINLQLRAERSGSGDGRVYTIAITATDASGNSSTAPVEIIVPHDKGKK